MKRFQTLQNYLQHAITKVETFLPKGQHGPGLIDKTRFLWAKSAIIASVTEIVEWQRASDPSWFLIARISSSVVDESVQCQRAERKGPIFMVRALRDTAEPRHVDVSADVARGSAGRSDVQYLTAQFLPSCGSAGPRLVERIAPKRGYDPTISTNVSLYPGTQLRQGYEMLE